MAGECTPLAEVASEAIRAQLTPLFSGGGRGIRTPERVTPLTVFKTAAFNHSAIPPYSR